MTRTWDQYRQIWLVDFEYTQPDGECPGPVCLVAWELKSERKMRIWRDDFGRYPPYDVGPDSLFVAYSAVAELSCHLVLGWPVPENVLDLYFEFRNLTNGMRLLNGDGLVGALTFFNLPSIGALQKDAFRELIMSGGPWSAEEKVQILDYCETDVVALEGLSRVMVPKIHLGQALLRGKFAVAVAVMEHRGGSRSTSAPSVSWKRTGRRSARLSLNGCRPATTFMRMGASLRPTSAGGSRNTVSPGSHTRPGS